MFIFLSNYYPYLYRGILIVSIVPLVLGPLLILAHTYFEGRAVGTLGIIIAGFGVLGEAYQFTTQLVV